MCFEFVSEYRVVKCVLFKVNEYCYGALLLFMCLAKSSINPASAIEVDLLFF